MARGLSGVQFGKIHVYSSDESLDKIFLVLGKIVKKYKYPELEDFNDEEVEVEEELDTDDLSTDKNVSVPWDKSGLLKNGENRGSEN